jgi:hypothetical protein
MTKRRVEPDEDPSVADAPLPTDPADYCDCQCHETGRPFGVCVNCDGWHQRRPLAPVTPNRGWKEGPSC